MRVYKVVEGSKATKEDIDNFVQVVVAGGAVQEQYVRNGAARVGAKLIFASVDGELAGVAALKVPSENE